MSENNESTSQSLVPTVFGVMGVLLLCAVIMIVTLLGRHTGGFGVPSTTHVVHVQEHEFGIRMPSTLPSGNVVFVDTNAGSVPHELVMFKLSGPNAAMPLRKNGEFNEDSSAVEDVMDSGDALAPGETRVFGVDLDPGTYVVVCNLPAHYRLGMRRLVTVK